MLTPEQVAEIDVKLGNAPEPTPAPEASAEPSTTTPNEAAASPIPTPALPQVLRRKVQGQEMEVPLFVDGRINPLIEERFGQAEDYTRKTQALAERERQYQAELQAERTRVLEMQAKLQELTGPKFDGLSDDDPYKPYLTAMQQALLEIQKEARESRERVQMFEQREQQAEQMRMFQAVEQEIKQAHPNMTQKHLVAAEAIWLSELQQNPELRLQDVAAAYMQELDAQRTAAVEEFKKSFKAPDPVVPPAGATNVLGGTPAPRMGLKDGGAFAAARAALDAGRV